MDEIRGPIRHVGDLLPAYLNGTLSAADQAAVQAHLMVCPLCQSELDGWMAVADVAAQAAAPAPSPALLERVLASIEGQGVAVPAAASTVSSRETFGGQPSMRNSARTVGNWLARLSQISVAARVGGLMAASLAVTLLLLTSSNLGFLVLLRDFTGTGYYQVGNYGYSDGTYGTYGLPCGPTTPDPSAPGNAACTNAVATSTSTTAPTSTATRAPTTAPTTAPTSTSAPSISATDTPAPAATAAATATTAATATPAASATAAATSTTAAVSPTAVSGGPTVAAGTPVAIPTTTGGAAPQIAVTLPGGQQVIVIIDPSIVAGLPPGQRGAVVFDPAPALANSVQEGALGGGNTQAVGKPLDIKFTIQDVATGGTVSAGGDTLDRRVQISLPIPNVNVNTAGGEQFAWLQGVYVDGQFIGYLRLPATFDPKTNSLQYSVSVADLQGTLFLPVVVRPAWLQNFDATTHMWSGPTGLAIDFGEAAPQFTTFTVVGPQVAGRIFVYNPFSGNYGWIDVTGVGPSGPPTS